MQLPNVSDAPSPGCVSIGEGVRFNGKLELPGVLDIHGQLDGEVVAEEVRVGVTGRVKGSVTAGNADIQGEIEKDITVTNTLVLRSTAKVRGNVTYEILEIEQGATIEGELKRGGGKEATDKSSGKSSKSKGSDAGSAEPPADASGAGPLGGNWS